MRLDKFLWEKGTRSELKKLIKKGIVTVDGKVVTDSGFQVNEESQVYFDGKLVKYREFIYLVMNKPPGVISATFDKKLPTVIDLLKEEYRRFEPFPVGRLDIDTEGLLIITNDGELAHNLTSPKKDVKKTYLAKTEPPMDTDDVKIFEEGMDLGDFVTKPAELKFTDTPEIVYITISEGKFHQVKRMCEKCGKKVTYLKRVSIGNLCLGDESQAGEIYEISKDELINQIEEE